MGLQSRTRDIIDTAVEKRTDFHRGNVSGKWYLHNETQTKWGWLDNEWANVLNSDILDKGAFVLFSYNTPMAWWNGESWRIPNEHYSQTTTQHQHAFRVAIRRSYPNQA